MQAVPFFGFWVPRVPLDTDIIPIEKVSAPEKVRLFTGESDVTVKPGDNVKTGQRLSADLVSPAAGCVTEVQPFRGVDGEELTSICIDVAEKDEIVDGLTTIEDFAGRGKDEIVAALVALGFAANWDGDIDVAVLSCLDTDPVNTVNQQVLRENADGIEGAVALLAAVTGPDRVVVAVTKQLRGLVRKVASDRVKIAVVDPVYPNGLPEVLLPKAAPDARRGLVVGVERALAMAQALKTGKPQQDKVVTLSVPGMGLRKNVQVRIGAPIADILTANEVDVSGKHKLILGGVMRGVPCYSEDFAVTPTTDSLYVQDESSVVEHEDNPCIHCGRCSAVCPVDMQVNLICRYAEYGLFEPCRELRVDDCIDCGLCAYACMARRPLVHYIKLAKAEVAKIPAPEPEEVAP